MTFLIIALYKYSHLVSLDVMVESLSGGSRPEIQEEGKVMELKNVLFKYSRRSWREANCVRLSATS